MNSIVEDSDISRSTVVTGRSGKARVCIVYPADPLGNIPGGIDTFIRGILRWAPDDIDIRLVGVTTDYASRPLRQWSTCRLGDRSFRFYPILAIENSERQARVPVTLRFLAALGSRRVDIPADVLEFHRIEPCLRYFRDKRPKTLVMHQNMENLRNAGSDIRWSYLPRLYFALEDAIFPRLSSVYCVRNDAAENYRSRYPQLAERIHFTPTWVDAEVFQPPNDAERERGKASLEADFGFSRESFVMITVGRIDKQKDPLLLIDAFQKVHLSMPDVRLLMVGDGVLRGQVTDRIGEYGLESSIVLCGVKGAPDISRYLQSADMFVLSSAYEGMPMCVLEALGSALPVVTTDVGEVSLVVKSGTNGEVISEHESSVLASAISRCRKNIDAYRGEPCLTAVENYAPQKVLEPIYANYRHLASQADRSRGSGS